MVEASPRRSEVVADLRPVGEPAALAGLVAERLARRERRPALGGGGRAQQQGGEEERCDALHGGRSGGGEGTFACKLTLRRRARKWPTGLPAPPDGGSLRHNAERGPSEAGENPARPRHCKRPGALHRTARSRGESSSASSHWLRAGGAGKASEAASSQETDPVRSRVQAPRGRGAGTPTRAGGRRRRPSGSAPVLPQPREGRVFLLLSTGRARTGRRATARPSLARSCCRLRRLRRAPGRRAARAPERHGGRGGGRRGPHGDACRARRAGWSRCCPRRPRRCFALGAGDRVVGRTRYDRDPRLAATALRRRGAGPQPGGARRPAPRPGGGLRAARAARALRTRLESLGIARLRPADAGHRRRLPQPAQRSGTSWGATRRRTRSARAHPRGAGRRARAGPPGPAPPRPLRRLGWTRRSSRARATSSPSWWGWRAASRCRLRRRAGRLLAAGLAGGSWCAARRTW